MLRGSTGSRLRFWFVWYRHPSLARRTTNANPVTSAVNRCRRVALQRIYLLGRDLLASVRCIFVLEVLNQVSLKFQFLQN